MPSLEGKLALRSVRRSLGEYSVYFATLAFCACLLYTYASSQDYLVALGVGEAALAVFAQAASVIRPLGAFSVVVFCFLVRYANRFLVRRRKAELATMELVGMRRGAVARVLFMECGLVAVAALMGGIVLGVALSPALASLTAWVFGQAWHPVVVLSPAGCAFAALGFIAVMAASALGALAELGRTTLLALMQAGRVPEGAKARSRGSALRDLVLGSLFLAVVYVMCWSVYLFMALMIPAAILACAGTYLVLRALSHFLAQALRRRRGLYLRGLTSFVTRQLEAHVKASCAALTCAAALLSVGICALGIAVGIRSAALTTPPGDPLEVQVATGTLVYIVLFFGLTFMVSAVAVLALQQLSEAAENREHYVELRRLGASEKAMGHALFSQVAVYFLLPAALVVLHDVFGFMAAEGILQMLGAPAGSVDFSSILALVMAAFGLYLVVTYRACRRSVLR